MAANELTEAFDRLAVPSWVRHSLAMIVAEGWQAGYEAGISDGSTVFMPDGRGLPDEALAVINEADARVPIHLRLTSADGKSARGACDRGLGEWWTGVGSQVTCPGCLELVHA